MELYVITFHHCHHKLNELERKREKEIDTSSNSNHDQPHRWMHFTLFETSVVGKKWACFFVSVNLCLSSFVSLWRLQLVYVLWTFSFCLMQSSLCFQYKHQKFNILCSHSFVVSTGRVQQKKQNYCQSAKEGTEICRYTFIASISDVVPQQYALFCLQTLSCLPIRSVVLAKQSRLVFALLCHTF